MTIRTTFAFAALFISAITGASLAKAHDHRDPLWTQDQGAYRMYRELRPAFRRNVFARAPLINENYLIDTLAILSGENDPVLSNRGKKPGRLAAREFMRSEFASFGYTVSEQAYGSGVNLIAERAGKSGKFLIVSAHYDSVNNAGADDDGTGVVSMMATARMLQGKELNHGVRFVAFDEEELGLVGSAAYVKYLISSGQKDSIIGDLQMEMMGYNKKNDGKFHVITCNRPDSAFFGKAFDTVVARLGTGLQITTTCTDRSDHGSFWARGIPAVVLSENFFGGDANPCYHKACDKMNIMNLDYFARVAEASAGVVSLIIAE